ncbi:hypothetical protein F1C58_16575 (plasmid) [Glaciihabitans sp. INWT7]|uniref:RCC1 domain-containing protein n=1 Tax=Glaciihabitans sp. INWT7 TaxID=2596912 RepID=UPI001626719E|nr:hypothetical protein [Glaciihabitans sp. INWT7]QNE48672.1 hypothetical protein F1C58_16575 [Glaciihabitans sp. INWT7]
MTKFSYKAVLASKRGFAEVLGLSVLAIIVMFAVGVTVVNFSAQSTLVAQTKNLTAAVESRANEFAGQLNTSLTSDSVTPSLAFEWDARTGLGTTITSLGVNPDKSKTLVVHAASESGRFAIDRTVRVSPTVVTHVTGFDAAGYPVWALAPNELADTYTLWGFTAGSIRPLTLKEQAGQSKDATNWITAASRLAIDSSGHLWGWGANASGQLGDGTTTDSASPVPLTPAVKYRKVVTDATSSFAVDSKGALWVWGANTSNKLGLAAGSGVPVRGGINYPIQTVATGSNSTFAIDSQGRLWAWGQNANGRLGTGSAAASIRDAEQVAPGQTFFSVTTQAGSTFAIDTAGSLWAWGANAAGQLGLGTTVDVATPTQVGVTKFASIQTSGRRTAAVDMAGKLWAWGLAGAAGDGTNLPRTSPVLATTTDTFSTTAADANTSYAISTAGNLYAWGANAGGQYGDGTTTVSRVPKLAVPGVTFIGLSVDAVATAAMDSRGGLWSFGHSDSGLWPVDFGTTPNTALKMPFPDGSAPTGWK